ncbi:hypothetical protein DPMN_145055 [Dreissena polymorpha]|uniref:Uncharacterized protein n=1 Tax=Dreissena polymorpha TaxID=45954 RepID=A0A9D4F950_DREPO|nr:hypothetical protein DPMN_145055 [Dreissena polymorpha]
MWLWISKAYAKALSPNNLYASFRKHGIYPYYPNALDSSIFKPSALQQQNIPPSIQPSELEVSNIFFNKEANIKIQETTNTKAKVPQFNGQWQGYNLGCHGSAHTET